MNMENNIQLPEFLEVLLKEQYGEEICNNILEGLSKKRVVSMRVNTLKTNVETIKSKLLDEGIQFETVLWSDNAIIIKNADEDKIKNLDFYQNGEIYLQSLSSMLPPIILNPKENKDILDMCAAPRR